MFKRILFCLLFLLLLPKFSQAATVNAGQTFKARVVEVIDSVTKYREDGSSFLQQDLKLIGLEGKWQDEEIMYKGVSDIEVTSAAQYKVGDRVFVDAYQDIEGEQVFYISDFVRTNYLYLLFAIFVLVVLVVGKAKGLKALLGLFISFFVIIKFILPQILAGRDPFLISLLGGLLMLGIIIYLTEGINKKSHIAILSVLISLSFTLALSLIFTNLVKLTGLAQEEAMFLIGLGEASINFKGLLLAGFIIGSIGVLDDIIIGQIEAVEQIREANPKLPAKKVFSLSYKIGNTHLGAITNTLFLTYAGAALPLLIIFIVNQDAGATFGRLINMEAMSTEIVRTLVGSIGVILSMPIATFLAAVSFGGKKD